MPASRPHPGRPLWYALARLDSVAAGHVKHRITMSVVEPPPHVAPPPADAARVVDLPRRWTLTFEQVAYLSIFALALLTRLWHLGDRALHHDETLHAFYSWRLFVGEGFVHDPLLHGPFLYHLGALIFFLFGDSDATARLGVALFGSVLVVLPCLIRRELGRTAALLASVYLLISPTFLYMGRFVRHDMYAVTFELLTFASIVRYASTRQARWLYIGAAALGLMFTTMETFFLYVAIFGTLLALVLLWRVWRPGVVAAAALGLAVAALVFVLPGEAQRPFPGSDTVERANGPYICPTPENPTPPANPIRAVPGPIFGFGPLATADNDYALCVRHQPDNNFGVYFIKLGQFFGHPAIVLALGLSAAGIAALYVAIWRRRDAVGTTAWQRARARSDGVLEAFASLAWERRAATALAIFGAIYVLLFTAFFTNPAGVISGATGSLLYWLAQHGVQRGSQPGYYYLVLLTIYEPLALLWGTIGLVLVGALIGRRLVKRPAAGASAPTAGPSAGGSPGAAAGRPAIDWHCALPIMLAWWALATVALYSWAGEKMPWLTTHVALPLVLLGAWGGAQTLRWWQRAGGAVHATGNWEPDRTPADDGYERATTVVASEPRSAGRPLVIYLGLFGVVTMLCFLLLTVVGKPNDPRAYLVPFVPLLLLALTGLLTLGGGLLHGARWAIGALAIAVTLLGGVYTVRSAYQLAYRWGDVPREMLIYTQTSPDVARVIERLEQASIRRGGGLDMPIWYDNETVWQWYLRRFTHKQQQPPALTSPPGPEVMAVLMLQENMDANPQNTQNLQGFRIQRYPLRWWFPEEQTYRLPPNWATAPVDEYASLLMRLLRNPFDGRTAAQLWQFLFYRQVPAPIGSTDFVLAIRPELAEEIGPGTGATQ